MMIATTIAAGTAAVIGTPLVLALTWWTQQTPQRLARLSSSAVLFPVTGGLVAGVALLTTHGTSTLVAGIPILILGGAAALTDVRELRLPNRLTGPLLLGALITLVIAAARTGDPSVALRGIAASAAAATMMGIARAFRPAAVVGAAAAKQPADPAGQLPGFPCGTQPPGERGAGRWPQLDGQPDRVQLAGGVGLGQDDGGGVI